ncbi:alpha/beta fold hydrolase [Chitinophaga silvatica]|uniref:Alpha/beta fold hydrolase n=1 Tax=Chitinophaga silvatica TaxID=2282649 RepID=A0A3E1YG47_9BACT|nr:alpha/beta fold hydrolase [Chitinophaga silvatica]RFS26342.1 alpha/beta fold hydrolase [Chitinophaga silvatica]
MKWFKRIALSLLGLYILICTLVYFFQEHLIFFPEKLPQDYKFQFNEPFIEKSIIVDKGIILNGLLFRTPNSKGCVFYLHGNGGSIRNWGEKVQPYLDLDYDVFLLDYRGYGKSNGTISNENTLYKDIQVAYDSIVHIYPEDKITVLGYSLGTGLAANLVSKNHPKQLILLAPYYSFSQMAKEHFPFLPKALIRYHFPTWEYLKQIKAPVTVFHGDIDEVINCSNSTELLKPYLKQEDHLYVLRNQQHDGITDNISYLGFLQQLLP